MCNLHHALKFLETRLESEELNCLSESPSNAKRWRRQNPDEPACGRQHFTCTEGGLLRSHERIDGEEKKDLKEELSPFQAPLSVILGEMIRAQYKKT